MHEYRSTHNHLVLPLQWIHADVLMQTCMGECDISIECVVDVTWCMCWFRGLETCLEQVFSIMHVPYCVPHKCFSKGVRTVECITSTRHNACLGSTSNWRFIYCCYP